MECLRAVAEQPSWIAECDLVAGAMVIEERVGSAVEVHWVDRAYLTADPEISRVVGPAIKRRHELGGVLDEGDTDVLCDACGHVLHEGPTTRVAARRDQAVLDRAR